MHMHESGSVSRCERSGRKNAAKSSCTAAVFQGLAQSNVAWELHRPFDLEWTRERSEHRLRFLVLAAGANCTKALCSLDNPEIQLFTNLFIKYTFGNPEIYHRISETILQDVEHDEADVFEIDVRRFCPFMA